MSNSDMEAFMEADAQLTTYAVMSYDYDHYYNENYKIMVNRVGCTVEEIAEIHKEILDM